MLDKLIINGGNKLKGEVRVSGSKNAALPIFVSTILAPGINEISNVPFLRDINTTPSDYLRSNYLTCNSNIYYTVGLL